MRSRKEVNKICKDCECNNNGWCVMLETNRYEDKINGCGILDDPTNFVDRVIRGEQEEVDEELDVELYQTAELMNSVDYKDRFKAEYLQLKIRMNGLKTMLDKYKAGILPFKPSCSYDLLNGQYKAMILYASYLEERAKIENIDIKGKY